MINKYLLAVSLSALILGSEVKAEPSPLVKKLMDTQVSLFHYGLDRIRQVAKEFANGKSNGFASVNYAWDKNIINVAFLVMRSSCKERRECEDIAKTWIRDFTEQVCFTSTNSRDQCDALDGLSSEFAPTGFDIKSFHAGKSSTEAIQDLRYVFEISAFVSGADKKTTTCRRKYTEKEIFCTTESR